MTPEQKRRVIPALQTGGNVFTRSMAAGTALLVFTACCTHRAAGPNNVTGGPVKATQNVFSDEEGNTVMLRLDGTHEQADLLVVKDRAQTTLKIHDYPVKDVALCLLSDNASSTVAVDTAKHPGCQRASSVTNGMWIKFGTASCTCYSIANRLKCYGTDCP